MRREIDVGNQTVVLMDSISLLVDSDTGRIVVCASHGGTYAGEVALAHAPAWVSFNDAGGGKEGAGTRALARLETEGIPACTVSHDSARIGDVDDHWDNGIVSLTNARAEELGARIGMPLKEVVALVAGTEQHG